MKKILLYSTLALGVGLCSCSQEDLGENPAQAAGQPVTVSVQLPGEVGSDGLSRALPTIPENCVLRCILFVSDNDESTEDIRQEVIAENANGNITFSFTPPADTYTCSFWADFLPKDGSVTGEGDEKRYTDLYYNTQNLPNVTFADNTTILFNNDACDAFTGHFDQTQITSGTPVTLSRPLAKVNFVAKEGISGNVSVTSGYTVANGMNISTGAINAAEPQKSLTYNGAVANAADKVLFYNYLFADGESTKLPASISYTLGDKEGTIPTGEMILTANTPYNLSFSTASGEVVTSPAVGDYFFTDGTWSSSLDGENANKTVAGVVFAVKNSSESADNVIDADVIGNYNGVTGIEGKEVLAWVVSASAPANCAFASTNLSELLTGVGTTDTDIMGYANSKAWNTSNASGYTAVANALGHNVNITEGSNSGWYLPAVGQMKALLAVYAENSSNAQGNALAVKNSLQALEDAEKGALMVSNYHWTSTNGNDKNDAAGIYRIGFHSENNYAKSGVMTTITGNSSIRPILTIFK